MCKFNRIVFPKVPLVFLAIVFLVLPSLSRAEPTREYPFSYGDPLDSRNVVRTSIALNKLGHDFYREGISPLLPESLEPWVAGAWSFFWTFNLTMWPHDYGHWARANQAGGDFIIDSYAFPLPEARMVVPAGTTLWQETLMSGGGFEINTMMRKHTEDRYFQTGFRDAEDMVHSFIQSMMFPIYSVLIAPINTSDPSSWYGDPIQYTQLVFENYSGRPSVVNNVADPGMVSLYKEMFWVNLLVTALDPWMYFAAEAFSLDLKDLPQLDTRWLYSSNDFSWAYTTRFNTGVLGYEVYLTQHIKVDDEYFSVYLRAGRPFKNYGVGARFADVLTAGDFSLDATIDAWDQDNYGTGGMIGISPGYRVGKNLRVSVDLHWKSDGYALGLPLEEGLGWLLNGTMYW
ncbi:MAG: hypothetical protein OEW60_00920 [Thiovulaceae bacterium]|nr:hypothetical protein [Sulfurimonadaceae bacterium]